ncbi:MAG: AMP-binding protein, partial [Lachnospira sp.]|nr:AMP-binding protein [Lachnospira sp.]
MNTIIEKFMSQVNENKDALAVFDNERNLSRKELLLLADSIAARLPKGCKRVGIMMNHSVEMIAAIFAVLRVGASYIPVEPFFPKERIRYMMEEAEVGVLITNTEYADRFPELTNITVDKGFAIDENATVSTEYDEKELAYILYTSGTTGKPKGVSVTNANVCHYVRAFRNEFHPALGDIMLQHSVCSFDIFVEEVFTTLLSGAALAIPSDEERA